MSDILNPADEENLLTPEDEHGGSKDEIQNGQKSPSTVNEWPAAKEQPPCISRDRKRPSSEKSATKKFRPRNGTQSQREDKDIKSIKRKIESSAIVIEELEEGMDLEEEDAEMEKSKKVSVPNVLV